MRPERNPMAGRPRTVLSVTVALLAIAAAACAHAPASPGERSYTAAQADAGATAFQAVCVTCHMSDLSGSEAAPPLAGPTFATRWEGRPFTELTVYMRDHMPRTLPRVLNDRTYLAVVAYVLRQNGMPAGDAALTFEATGTIVTRASEGP
jgi:mono/diheme cytochrome c family protein